MERDDEKIIARCLTCDETFDVMLSDDGIHCSSCMEEYEDET